MRHKMMTASIRLRLVLALLILRGVASRYHAEIKFLSLIAAAYIGSDYINSVAEYAVCIVTLARKYRLGFILK